MPKFSCYISSSGHHYTTSVRRRFLYRRPPETVSRARMRLKHREWRSWQVELQFRACIPEGAWISDVRYAPSSSNSAVICEEIPLGHAPYRISDLLRT